MPFDININMLDSFIMSTNELFIIGKGIKLPETILGHKVKCLYFENLEKYSDFISNEFSGNDLEVRLGLVQVESLTDIDNFLKINNSEVPAMAFLTYDCSTLTLKCLKDLFVDVLFVKTPQILQAKILHYLQNGHDYKKKKILNSLNESDLTRKELKILETIIETPNMVIRRDELQKIIWGRYISANTLDVHLCNLRKKLQKSRFQINSLDNGKLTIREKDYD